MRKIRTVLFGGVAMTMLAALLVAAPAHAQRRWEWRHGPHGYYRYWYPGVVVAAPPPVYYAPPPPVVYAPPPAYYAPPVVVGPPVIGLGIGIHIR